MKDGRWNAKPLLNPADLHQAFQQQRAEREARQVRYRCVAEQRRYGKQGMEKVWIEMGMAVWHGMAGWTSLGNWELGTGRDLI